MSVAEEWAKRYKEARTTRPEFTAKQYGRPVLHAEVTDQGNLQIQTRYDNEFEIYKDSVVIPANEVKFLLGILKEWYA